MKHLVRWFALLAFAYVLSGCHPLHTVEYDTAKIVREYARPVAGSLHVRTFGDGRSESAKNKVLMALYNEATIGGVSSCVNGEDGYHRGQVPREVTTQIGLHLQKRGAFAKVTTGGAPNSEYVLSGTLGTLYAVQETSTSAQVGAQFGLLGALATSGATSKGVTHVVFRDLVLEHTASGRRVRVEDVDMRFEGELHADAYCWSAYENADAALQQAVARLADNVERRVQDYSPPASAPRPVPQAAPLPAPAVATFGTLVVTARVAPAERPSNVTVVDDANVFINGRFAGKTPFEDGLPTGTYDVVVTRESAPPVRQQVRVRANQRHAIDARLVRPLTSDERMAIATARDNERRARRAALDADHAAWAREQAAAAPARTRMFVGGVAALIVGAGCITTGALLKGTAGDDDDEVKALVARWRDEPSEADRAPLEERIREAQDTRDRHDIAGSLLLGVGAAGLATSAVLFILLPDLREEPPTGASLAITPSVGPQHARLELSGAF